MNRGVDGSENEDGESAGKPRGDRSSLPGGVDGDGRAGQRGWSSCGTGSENQVLDEGEREPNLSLGSPVGKGDE